MSLLSRLQLSLATLASKDESRFALTHLHLTGKTVEITDGHILVQVTQTDTPNEDDFPVILPDTTQAKDGLIPADAAGKALKALPKSATLPILSYAQIKTHAAGHLMLGTTDLSTPQVLSLRPTTDLKFPDSKQVIPKKEDGKFSIAFNPNLLIPVLQYAAKFGRLMACELTFYSSDAPMRIDWADGEHTAIAVIMPMRMLEGKAKEMPGNTPDATELAALRAFYDGIMESHRSGDKKAVREYLKTAVKAEEAAKKLGEDNMRRAMQGPKPADAAVEV